MKNPFLLFILSLFVSNSLTAQNIDWQPMSDGESLSVFLTKQDNNVIYVVDSELDIEKREGIIADTRKSIAKNLDLLQEINFNAPLYIFLIADRNRMYKFSGRKTLYSAYINEDLADISSISSVYDANHSPLNLGLMKAVVIEKWGKIKDDQLIWLEEGLASYATPEAYSCDGYSFEERYIGFLQKNRTIDLLQFPQENSGIQYKIACNQAAYLVEYLLKHYGVDKLKQLWQGGMSEFENIYETSLTGLIIEINEKLYEEFREEHGWSISFFMDNFERDCIEPEADGWFSAFNPSGNAQLERMLSKDIEGLEFTVDSIMPIQERDSLIIKTKKYITQNLELINEYSFSDSIHIIVVPNRAKMAMLAGDVAGTVRPKDGVVTTRTIIHAIHSDKQSVLKHELMHVITDLKWGSWPSTWLDEGLATYANLEPFDCDGHTLEERYAYFLQSGRLVDGKQLLTEFYDDDTPDELAAIRTAYNQSAYIVGYLIENYGVAKLKRLWQNGHNRFEEIYDISFDALIRKINKELNEKYPEPIDFNWEKFSKGCIE